MRLSIIMRRMRLIREVIVSELLSQFVINELSSIYGNNHIVSGASEVRTDCLAIICNNRYFHFSHPFANFPIFFFIRFLSFTFV